MATESTWSTASTTLTDRLEHPVKEFLADCGLDVSSFPKISLLVEINEAIFKNTQIYIPLRIPGRPGVVFETHCRIIRATEVPSLHSKEHRRFVEIEWVIEENPLLEAEHHAVFSFLSGEVECPACKHLFTPEPSILDDRSVKVTCNNCLHYWTIKVDSPSLNSPRMRLITDSFYKDPSKIQKSMAEWDVSTANQDDENYKYYFPVNFESLSVDASLEFLFGERKAFQLKSGKLDNDFEVLSKALINLLAFHYFRRPAESKYASKLEQTDICRKSDVQFKEEQRRRLHAEFFPTREFETIKTKPKESPFEELRFGDTVVKEVKWTSPYITKAQTRSIWPVVGAIAASLMLLSGIGIYFFIQRDGEYEKVAFQNEEDSSISDLLEPTPSQALEKVERALPNLKSKPDKIAKAVTEELKQETQTTAVPKKVEKPTEAKPVSKLDEPGETASIEQDADQKIEKLEEPQTAQPIEAIAAIEKEIKGEVATKVEKTKVEVEPAKPEARNLAKLALVDAGYRQGMLHLKLQQAKEAAEEFEKVIELDPQHIESYRNLGLAYVYDRRFKEAITAFEAYLTLAGNSEDRNSVEELLTTLKDRVSLSEANR